MTRIADLLEKGKTYSFEFFPPKTDAEQATLVTTLRELEPLSPSFVSVTYRGGAESRRRTVDLVTGMLRTTNLVPMAHLICVAHTRLELAEILVELRRSGIDNLMALGGDPPTDPEAGTGELAHASDLVELARAIGGFSIGVAAQPTGHPLSADLPSDRDHLAMKLAMADFAVTQFFFEAADYTSSRCCRGSCRSNGSAPCRGWPAWAPPFRPGWWSGSRRPMPVVVPRRFAAKVWPAPPSCASSSWTPASRGCTSTR